MVAMERFRVANGRWLGYRPTRTNPCTPEGWAVYCVGPGGMDNGSNLDPKFREQQEGVDKTAHGSRAEDSGGTQPGQPHRAVSPDSSRPSCLSGRHFSNCRPATSVMRSNEARFVV